MHKFILFILLSFIISCSNQSEPRPKGIDFVIINHTDFTIRDIIIRSSPISEVSIDSISSGLTESGFLSMEKELTDGNYALFFFRHDSSTYSTGAGYYTNGAPLDSKIICEIYADTVEISFEEVKALY